MTKILGVDDNATNRKLVVTLLSFDGYLTAEAVDGADALAAARRERPELVISDITSARRTSSRNSAALRESS